MQLEPGMFIEYSNEPDYSDDFGDPEWETGMVIGPWPGRPHMFVVWWFEALERTVDHIDTLKTSVCGSYRIKQQ